MTMRDLRNPSGAWRFEEAARLCSLVWQGDFGTGQPTGSGVWSDPGANPCKLTGPALAAGVSSGGIPVPNWKLGMIVSGDLGAEFVLCKLTLSATTDLLPGQAYVLDKDFNLALLSTTVANNPTNSECGVLNIWSPATPAGTYYAWLQRAGHCSVQAIAGSVANGFGETNATTAGTLKFPASATVGQRSVAPSGGFTASSGVTFTGATTSGSPYITAIASIADLQVGQVITGTNLPANAIIAALFKQGTSWTALIGTNTAGSYSTVQNATGTASGTTFTVTSHVTANVYWPTISKTN
jgi:hypothetical protein